VTDQLVEDLPVRVELLEQDEREDGDRTYTLKLTAGDGAVLLKVQRRLDSPWSDAHFELESARSGALFWRAMARWLRVPVPAGDDAEPGKRLPVLLLSMGALPSKDGHEWRALKLFVGDPADPAELFFNVAIETDGGVFREKDVAFRAPLVAQLAAAFGDVSGMPPVEVAAEPPHATHSPTAPTSSFKAGDAIQHRLGPGTVTSIQTIEIDGHHQVMLEIVLHSGVRMMIPESAATAQLRPASAPSRN
jgi:urease beta subunit